MNLGNQLRLHRAGFTTIASFPQYRQTPIVVSEADPDGCAACTSSRVAAAAYRNSTAYGAYEVSMMKRTLELEAQLGVNVRGLVTWAFLFEDVPYFAGYRVLESNGIHMPVLNAFKLLGKLAGNRVPITSSGARTLDDVVTNSVRQQPDVDAMATRNGRQVQVLVWNYHDDLVDIGPSPVELRVDVPADFGPDAVVSHLRVDEAHGDAYSVWLSQGSPATPSATQLAALRQAMEPSPLEPERRVAVTASAVNLRFDLPRFGISLVTLTPPGGNGGAGGSGGSGGAQAGAAGSSGATGASGAAGSGGAAGTSANPGAGQTSNAGQPASGGQRSNGGQPSNGSVAGSSGAAGVVGAAGSTTASTGDDSGCGCRVRSPSSSQHSASAVLALLVALGLLRRRAWHSPTSTR